MEGSAKKFYKEFKQKHDKFMLAVDALMENRTADLLSWLKSKSLIDSLSEYHDGNINDGVVFNDVVGTAVFGINSSQNGKAQIIAWVKEHIVIHNSASRRKSRLHSVSVTIQPE